MESGKFDKYQYAAEIANQTLNKAKELCQQKQKASYICTFCDTFMKENLDKNYKKLSKGIGLPTCLSINNIVAHDSYTEDDDYQIKDNDIIRIELACYIDSNVSSVGDTIKIGDEKWEENELMIAAKKALEVGIKAIKPDLLVSEYQNNIKKVGKCFNLNVVERPKVFHEMDTKILYDWCFLDNDNFNEPSWVVKYDHELELEDHEVSEDEISKGEKFTVGEAYHLSVAFTKSNKVTIMSEKTPMIYQNTQIRYSLKSKYARELISYVNKNYETECFKISNVNMSKVHAKIGLKECLARGVIRSLGLTECRNNDVVILKCSIVIQNNSVYKLTGPKISETNTHPKLNEDLNNILLNSNKFNKRNDYLDF